MRVALRDVPSTTFMRVSRKMLWVSTLKFIRVPMFSRLADGTYELGGSGAEEQSKASE